jgi:hypothetical protein
MQLDTAIRMLLCLGLQGSACCKGWRLLSEQACACQTVGTPELVDVVRFDQKLYGLLKQCTESKHIAPQVVLSVLTAVCCMDWAAFLASRTGQNDYAGFEYVTGPKVRYRQFHANSSAPKNSNSTHLQCRQDATEEAAIASAAHTGLCFQCAL